MDKHFIHVVVHVTFGQRRMSERESTEALLSTYEVDRCMGLMGLDIPNSTMVLLMY